MAVLEKGLQISCRDVHCQICDNMDIQIIKGVIGKSQIHLQLSYSPKLSVSSIVKLLKKRSAKLLREEFEALKRNYWDGRLWEKRYGVWRIGNNTDKEIDAYLMQYTDLPNGDQHFILT